MDSSDRYAQSLLEFLRLAETEHMCVSIGCSTCGAAKFREGLGHALSGIAPQPIDLYWLDEISAHAIAAVLSSVPRDEHATVFVERSLRLVLYHLWRKGPHEAIQGLLDGSWAGELLTEMIAHDRRRQKERHDKEAFESPKAVEARREEKRRLRQDAHAERLKKKDAIDRAWRERQSREQGDGGPSRPV